MYPQSSNELETLCSHTSGNELRGGGFVGTIASSIQNIIIQGIEALFLGFCFSLWNSNVWCKYYCVFSCGQQRDKINLKYFINGGKRRW